MSYRSLLWHDIQVCNLTIIAYPKVGEQHIYRKYSKCNSFQVTTDLLNSENLRIAITQLCHELQLQVSILQCYS